MKEGLKFSLLVIVVLLLSCKAKHFAVTTSKTAVSLKLYNQSIGFLEKDFAEEKDPLKKKDIAFAIGESYRRFDDYENAEKWYQRCLDLNGEAPALYQLGMMLKQQEKYVEAIKVFEKYERVVPASYEGRQQANQCQQAIDWKKAFTNLQVKPLEALNTPASDYGLVPFKQDKFVLSSSRDEATGARRDGWTGEKFSDLFVTDKKESKFSAPANLGTPVNTIDHESSVTFSKDSKEMYFVRCTDEQQRSNQYCYIYYTAFNNEHWNEPVKLDLFADTVNVYDPFLSRDGKVLLVAADAPGGFGATDLYLIPKVDTGWGTPINLGGSINTPGSERFPWLDEKGALYFSSNGLPGMGGLDIFKATRTKNAFKDPVNLKYPINSGADDFAYWVDKNKPANADDSILSSGYFSSNRTGGKGKDDIYRFEEKWINIFVLNGKVTEKIYEDTANSESKVIGHRGLRRAKVDLKGTDDKVIATVTTDAGGNFTFPLNAETDYKLAGSKGGYFSQNAFTSTKGKRNRDSTIIHLYTEIELEKIFPQKLIAIPNIYYDYDKATLRPESKLVLDSILVFFKDNPDLTIELGSHTDSRGSDEYNLKLSQARAQSAVDYLVEKGVAKDKLIAHGYGETMPVNKCVNEVPCTEEEYQLNRRTTFKVISSKLNIESVEPDPGEIRVVPKPDEKKEK